LKLDPHAANQILRRVLSQHIAAPERLTVSQWADKYRILADKNAARKGRWDTDYSPHLRGVMDAFSDPVVRHLSIIKPTQCGGTEAVINMILWAIDCAPGDMYWVWANAENAKEFGKERLLPTIKACPKVAQYLSGKKHDETEGELILTHMTIRFRGAPAHGQAEQNLESWSAKYIANDELDRCALDTPDVMEARTSAYPTTSKLIDLGSPGNEGEGIDAQLMRAQGGGLYFWVPCPLCGVYFVRNFDMVHWEGGRKANWEHVKTTAWLRCPACDGKVEGHLNKKMMLSGIWAPDWDEHKPIKDNPLPSPERIAECTHAQHVGFRIGEFSDPHALNCYGNVAAVFVRNGCEATKSWTNRQRGRAWSIKGERAQESELRKLCTPIELGGYKLGTVPPGVLYLETAIDVQHREAWVRVRGWGRGGAESWLIWTERIQMEKGDLRALDKCVGWKFPLAPNWCDHNGEAPEKAEGVTATMRSCLTVIDSGNTNEDIDVYSWVLRHGGAGKNVYAIKGQPGTGNQITRSFWRTDLQTLPGGRAIPGGSPLVLVNVNTMHWKKWVLTRVNKKATVEAELDGDIDDLAGDDAEDIKGHMGNCKWRFPEATYEPGREEHLTSAFSMERYFKQITSEELVEVQKEGRKRKEWRLRAGGGRQNHLFDTECYGAAVLAMRSMWGAQLTRAFGVTMKQPVSTLETAPIVVPEPASAAVNRSKERGRMAEPSFMRHLKR